MLKYSMILWYLPGGVSYNKKQPPPPPQKKRKKASKNSEMHIDS